MATIVPTGDRRVYIALFLCLAAALLNAFRIDKHLSADGVHYFVAILESGDFFRVDSSRRFAEYLTQWPLVLAVRAGLTHVPTLSAIFALGLLLPHVLGFALCLFATRRENSAVLCLPILTLAAISLPSDYLWVGEHHVMVALASPILLLILRRSTPAWTDGLLLVVALSLFTRTYASAVVPALLFAALLAIRIVVLLKTRQPDRPGPTDPSSRRALLVWGVALALCITTVAVGAAAIWNPRDPTNRESFQQAIALIVRLRPLFLLGCCAALFLAGLAARRRAWQQIATLLATVALVLEAPYALDSRLGLSAHQSVAARSLSVTLLPVLLLAAVAVHRRAPALAGLRRVLFVALVGIVAAGNIVHSSHWARYRAEMRSVLNASTGYVPVEHTRLYANPSRWGWTSPQLSVVWSFPVVRAIVENRKGEPWVPFDPRETLVLTQYVRYDPIFASVTQQARFETPPVP